jgi:hypothetical protein
MDFFSMTNPELISSKTIKTINQMVYKSSDYVAPTWKSNLGDFYKNYIQPNLFPIIVFFILFIFLLIKYILKRDKDEKKESFDPSIPVKKQHMDFVDLADEVPVRVDGKLKTRKEALGDDEPEENTTDDILDSLLIEDDYVKYNDRETIVGLKNKLDEDVDSFYDENMQTTADAFHFGASHSRKNIDDLAKILFEENEQLTKNLK